MSRARGQHQVSATGRGHGRRTPGSVRLPVGTLGLANPPEGVMMHAHAMRSRIRAGAFDDALEELRVADWDMIEQRPLLRQVRNVFAEELVARVSEPHQDTVPFALHVLGLCRATSSSMVVGRDNIIHLVVERHRRGPGEHQMLAACGRTLFAGPGTGLLAAARGSWLQPTKGRRRCPGCEPHAVGFPECAERQGDPNMTMARTEAVHQAVSKETVRDVSRALGDLRHAPFDAVREHADGAYTEHLAHELVSAVRDSGEPLMREHLGAYYEQAHGELARAGTDQRDLASLVSADDWAALVEMTLSEQDSADHATMLLNVELRAIIDERIRRLHAASGPA